MELLKRFNWSKINEAYQLYINTGHILPNSVRPQIEQSWLRSKSINPWAPRPQPISDTEYRELLEENKLLVEVAKPVMEYMYATNNHDYVDNLINLGEKNGVVLHFCTRVNSFPSPLKKKIHESTIGTCITGITLFEKAPMEIGGAEQYSVCYQSCFGGGAPIRNSNGDIIGVVLLYNNYGKIPEQPLEFVETAALLIENLLINYETAKKNLLESNKLFTRMINYIEDYIIIVDNRGMIINFNDKFANLLGKNRSEIPGRSCRDFGIEVDTLISDSIYKNKATFYIKTGAQTYTCLLENNKTVRWLNNQEHTSLLFSLVDAPKRPVKKAHTGEEINNFENIIGGSSTFNKLLKLAKRAAEVNANVLLDGESGTGKEVFARAIHNESKRSKPFIAINCGSIPKEILQSELFGYNEGAFTGGKKGGQIGKFEVADGGTVFLDEIGEMPFEMQVSLLRFLQDRTVIRLGEHQGKKVDVRIIAATNKNLQDLVNNGKFRQDLYYRLNVIHITLPPLRDRKDDILLLADYFVQYYTDLYNKKKVTLAQNTQNLLYQYNWLGNVRELANVIENAVVFCDSDQIFPDLLPAEILEYQPELSSVGRENIKQQEKEIITRALIECKGNISNAASQIGISRNTLYRKIDKYGLHFLYK